MSFFYSDKAGAKHVYAVEASEMAEYARKLIAGNPSLGERITVSFHHVVLYLISLSSIVFSLIFLGIPCLLNVGNKRKS